MLFVAFNNLYFFCHFDYNVSWHVLLWVNPVWDSLGFLDFGSYFLSQVREVFTYYLFKYFLGLFFFLFSSDTPVMQILMLYWPVSGQSQGLACPKVGSGLYCWDCCFLASSVCSLVGEAALEACSGFQVGRAMPVYQQLELGLCPLVTGPCLDTCPEVAVSSLVFRQPSFWWVGPCPTQLVVWPMVFLH